MGLADELGYHFPTVGPFRRTVQRMASTRPGARSLAVVVPALDSGAQRVTGGRRAMADVLAGLPVLELTTRGRRSGVLRTVHLIAIPHGATLALVGTNFGGTSTPAWVHNLEAEPRATVAFRGRGRTVRARPAGPTEHEPILLRAEALYAGYGRYRTRITGRRLRVFVLEPGEPTTDSQAASDT